VAKTQFPRHKLDYQVPQEYLASEELASKAGTVPLAALSLFQGLTGGMDWGDMSGPMMELSASAVVRGTRAQPAPSLSQCVKSLRTPRRIRFRIWPHAC